MGRGAGNLWTIMATAGVLAGCSLKGDDHLVLNFDEGARKTQVSCDRQTRTLLLVITGPDLGQGPALLTLDGKSYEFRVQAAPDKLTGRLPMRPATASAADKARKIGLTLPAEAGPLVMEFAGVIDWTIGSLKIPTPIPSQSLPQRLITACAKA